MLRDEFIRLTKCSEGVVLNPNRFQLGRSAYICKSTSCINLAVKEKKILKMLRVSLKSVEKTILQLEEFSAQNSSSLRIKEVMAR